MLPSAELLAQWAAEELWDWRVRVLFAVVCILAVLAVLAIYLIWGRNRQDAEGAVIGRARKYTGRVCVALLVIAVAEASFFKEPVSTGLLLATAVVVGAIALSMPRQADAVVQARVPDE